MLFDVLSNSDPERGRRVMKEMLQMTKIDIETLERAAEGQGTE